MRPPLHFFRLLLIASSAEVCDATGDDSSIAVCPPQKIALPAQNGLTIVPVKEIIRCEAEVNYTNFFLTSKNKMLVSKTLKEFEELLNDYDFIRVHHSHLINLHHVKNYVRGEGGTITMTDGTEVDVSRRKKEEFLKRLASL